MEKGIPSCGPCRESAKRIVETNYEKVDKRARALRILLAYFPWHKLTEEEDEILWSYFLTLT